MKLRDDAAPSWKQVAPCFGITPVPLRMSMSPAQELASEIIAASMPAEPRTQSSYDRTQLIKQAVKDIKAGYSGQEVGARNPGIDKAVLNAAAAQTMIERLQYTPLQFQVHNLTPEAAMRVWRVATPAEQADLKGIIESKVANSKALTEPEKVAYLNELK